MQRASPEDDLLGLVTEICKYCLKYSAEAEACDLLMEIEKIEMIFDLVTEDISDRVCLYLTRLVHRYRTSCVQVYLYRLKMSFK